MLISACSILLMPFFVLLTNNNIEIMQCSGQTIISMIQDEKSDSTPKKNDDEKTLGNMKPSSNRWCGTANDLINKLQKIAGDFKEEIPILPEDTPEEKFRKLFVNSPCKIKADHCLWDLWLTTGKAPPLKKTNEKLVDYVTRCVNVYQKFIKDNQNKTERQILLQGLQCCKETMRTPLWYSAYEYFKAKSPLPDPQLLIICRNPNYLIFVSELPDDSYTELSQSYSVLLPMIEATINHEIISGESFTSKEVALEKNPLWKDEYTSQLSYFYELLRELPKPTGNVFQNPPKNDK